MAQAETTYQRSLEEHGRRWFREGRSEGIRQGRDEGQAAMLVQLAREKFDPEAAEGLSSLLGRASDSKLLSAAAKAVLESATTEGFLAWMRSL